MVAGTGALILLEAIGDRDGEELLGLRLKPAVVSASVVEDDAAIASRSDRSKDEALGDRGMHLHLSRQKTS